MHMDQRGRNSVTVFFSSRAIDFGKNGSGQFGDTRKQLVYFRRVDAVDLHDLWRALISDADRVLQGNIPSPKVFAKIPSSSKILAKGLLSDV